MLKMRIFCKKTVKIVSASEASNPVVFVDGGARMFLAPGRRVP